MCQELELYTLFNFFQSYVNEVVSFQNKNEIKDFFDFSAVELMLGI